MPILIPVPAMIFKKILKILLVVYLIWMGVGEINPLLAQEVRLEHNQAPIQEAEIRALIAKTAKSANARQIDQMIEDFAADAQITIYSLESDPIVFDRSAYYQNLATVFTHYRAYSNRMVIDSVKILDFDRAIVNGTTYEKIDFSGGTYLKGNRPINGVSNWQAKVKKDRGKVLFSQVDAHLSRAALTR